MPQLLRVADGAQPQALCITCHTPAVNIDMVGHGGEFLRAAGLTAGSCKPCHQVHADRKAIEEQIMWPMELCTPGPTTQPASAVDHHCLCCHRTDGPAPLPAAITHPVAAMFNYAPPGTLQYLPLYNADGQVDERGTLSCHTCHLTHGRSEPVPAPDGLLPMTPREMRARRWHIRPFVAGNVCTSCHGADALRRFMYFHDPQRRGGPIDIGPWLNSGWQ